MATVSFDKHIIIKDPQAVEKLVNSLKKGQEKKTNKFLASEENLKRSEQLLKQHCLHSNNY